MKKLIAAAALAVLAGAAAMPAANAASRVEVGVLNCDVSGGVGFVFGSSKSLACTFRHVDGHTEVYTGEINKWGIDIGRTRGGTIVWGVFAPSREVPPGGLEGRYAGVSAEATAGVGLGANALIGGFDKSVALQPFSVQAQEGLNFAAGIAGLQLRVE
ncbi:MAG TPA: DUF992 domain-containing protein [Hyphomicrobiales bacterium]|nr:DUF992 domain-containing protein [Hyphomicrobiales bacterium]